MKDKASDMNNTTLFIILFDISHVQQLNRFLHEPPATGLISIENQSLNIMMQNNQSLLNKLSVVIQSYASNDPGQ